MDWLEASGETQSALRLAAVLWRFWDLKGASGGRPPSATALFSLAEIAADEERAADAVPMLKESHGSSANSTIFSLSQAALVVLPACSPSRAERQPQRRFSPARRLSWRRSARDPLVRQDQLT